MKFCKFGAYLCLRCHLVFIKVCVVNYNVLLIGFSSPAQLLNIHVQCLIAQQVGFNNGFGASTTRTRAWQDLASPPCCCIVPSHMFNNCFMAVDMLAILAADGICQIYDRLPTEGADMIANPPLWSQHHQFILLLARHRFTCVMHIPDSLLELLEKLMVLCIRRWRRCLQLLHSVLHQFLKICALHISHSAQKPHIQHQSIKLIHTFQNTVKTWKIKTNLFQNLILKLLRKSQKGRKSHTSAFGRYSLLNSCNAREWCRSLSENLIISSVTSSISLTFPTNSHTQSKALPSGLPFRWWMHASWSTKKNKERRRPVPRQCCCLSPNLQLPSLPSRCWHHSPVLPQNKANPDEQASGLHFKTWERRTSIVEQRRQQYKKTQHNICTREKSICKESHA